MPCLLLLDSCFSDSKVMPFEQFTVEKIHQYISINTMNLSWSNSQNLEASILSHFFLKKMLEPVFTLLHVVFAFINFSRTNGTACSLQGQPAYPQIWKDGDIIVGGALNFHSSWEGTDLSYEAMPLSIKCLR